MPTHKVKVGRRPLMEFIQTLSTRDAIGLAYKSFNRSRPYINKGFDRDVRHPEWTRRLLDALGAPDDGQANVAVTGSKGKGSHAILLAAILQRAGLKVGLFTGPHLVDFMERFRINGRVIPEPRFVQYMERVYPLVESLRIPQDEYIGPVGVLAAVAALWFRDEQTDVNIYELGRGARYDDVNQIRHQGAVVSPIFLEHPLQLGPTLLDVATEKAGIVTQETSWVCSYTQTEQVLWRLCQACADKGAECRYLGSDFTYSMEPFRHESVILQVESLMGSSHGTSRLYVPEHLTEFAENVVVATDAARQVWSVAAPSRAFPNEINLLDLRLPGRLHVIQEGPCIVVDGTIHADSARRVVAWVKRRQESKDIDQVGVVFALPADKDGSGVVREVAMVADWAIVTRAKNPHLTFDDKVYDFAKEQMLDVAAVLDVHQALDRAAYRLGKNSLLLLLGTQSFVGDALAHFRSDSRSIFADDSAKEDSSFYSNSSFSEQRWV